MGSLLGNDITDPVRSLGVGVLVTDIAVSDPAGVLSSTTSVLAVSTAVLSLFWHRGDIDRRLALLCIALSLPTFAVTRPGDERVPAYEFPPRPALGARNGPPAASLPDSSAPVRQETHPSTLSWLSPNTRANLRVTNEPQLLHSGIRALLVIC